MPATLQEWRAVFGDDLGFETNVDPRAVSFPPGHPDKIAELRSRVSRGQRLWHPDDKREDWGDFVFDRSTWKAYGDQSFGVVVGMDRKDRHRHAIWKAIAEPLGNQKLLYINARAGYVDSFQKDRELEQIYRHARRMGASFVAVCSLFTARCKQVKDLHERESLITGGSMQWMRWLAGWVDKAIVCWGETPLMNRHADVLWMLSRTTIKGHVWCVSSSGDEWPREVSYNLGMDRFEFTELIEDHKIEHERDEIDLQEAIDRQ